jgi:hypothetical protein
MTPSSRLLVSWRRRQYALRRRKIPSGGSYCDIAVVNGVAYVADLGQLRALKASSGRTPVTKVLQEPWGRSASAKGSSPRLSASSSRSVHWRSEGSGPEVGGFSPRKHPGRHQRGGRLTRLLAVCVRSKPDLFNAWRNARAAHVEF